MGSDYSAEMEIIFYIINGLSMMLAWRLQWPRFVLVMPICNRIGCERVPPGHRGHFLPIFITIGNFSIYQYAFGISFQRSVPVKLMPFFCASNCQSVEFWLFKRWHSILWSTIFKTQYHGKSQQSPVIKCSFHNYFG